MTKKGRVAKARLPSFLSKREKRNEYTSDVLTKNNKYHKINLTNIRRQMFKKQRKNN